MKRTWGMALLLAATPAALMAQSGPDSARARPGAEQPGMRSMSPEQRRAYMHGVEDGRRMGRQQAARGMREHGMRGGAQRGGHALRAPGGRGDGAGILRMREQLNLSDDQVRRLEQIRDRQREQHRQLLDRLRDDQDKWREQRELFRQQTRALMLEVLTSEQRQQLERERPAPPAPPQR